MGKPKTIKSRQDQIAREMKRLHSYQLFYTPEKQQGMVKFKLEGESAIRQTHYLSPPELSALAAVLAQKNIGYHLGYKYFASMDGNETRADADTDPFA